MIREKVSIPLATSNRGIRRRAGPLNLGEQARRHFLPFFSARGPLLWTALKSTDLTPAQCRQSASACGPRWSIWPSSKSAWSKRDFPRDDRLYRLVKRAHDAQQNREPARRNLLCPCREVSFFPALPMVVRVLTDLSFRRRRRKKTSSREGKKFEIGRNFDQSRGVLTREGLADLSEQMISNTGFGSRPSATGRDCEL